MATYLAGLTDQVLPPVLYTPNWNMMLSEISQATSNWQQNKQALENLWAEYFNTPVTNPISDYHRKQFKDSIDKKIKELENYNLGDISVLNSLSDTIGEISSLPHVINDIKQTKALNEYAKNLEVAKFAIPDKDNGYLSYNPKQLENIERQKFILSRIEDPKEITNFKAYFPVHKDMDMIINDFAKEYNAEIVHSDFLFGDEKYKNLLGETVTPKYIVKTKNGIMTIPEWHQFVHRYLEENHNYSEQEVWMEEASIHQRIKETDPVKFKTLNLENYNSLAKVFLFKDIQKEREKLGEIEKTERDILEVLRQKKDKLYVELQEESDKIKNGGSFKGTDFVRLKEMTEEMKRIDEMIGRLETEKAKQLNESISKKFDEFYKEYLEKRKESKYKKKDEEFKLTEKQKKEIENLRQERENELINHIKNDNTVTFQDLLNIYRNIRSYTGTYDIAKDYAMTHFRQGVTADPFALAQLRKRPVGGSGTKEPTPTELETLNVDFQHKATVDTTNAISDLDVEPIQNRNKSVPKGTTESILKEVGIDKSKMEKSVIIKSFEGTSEAVAKYLLSIGPTTSGDSPASANATQANKGAVNTITGRIVSSERHPVFKLNNQNKLVISFANDDVGASYTFVTARDSYIDNSLTKKGSESVYAVGYATKSNDVFLKCKVEKDDGKGNKNIIYYSIVQPNVAKKRYYVYKTVYDSSGSFKQKIKLNTIEFLEEVQNGITVPKGYFDGSGNKIEKNILSVTDGTETIEITK